MRHLLCALVASVGIAPATAQLHSVPIYSTAFPLTGFRYQPFVALEGDAIHVAVIETAFTWQVPTLTYEMMYVRSADRGRTWASAVNLGASNSPAAAFASSASRLYALHDAAFVRSADAGLTWQATPNSTGMSVAVGQADGLQCHVLLFDRQSGSGPRSVAYVRTMDGGATWSQPQFVGNTLASIQTPQLILDGTTLHAFWSDRYRTHYQRSVDGGATWLATPTLLGSGLSDRDHFAAFGSIVHLLRTSSPVEYLRSTDGGATWSPPVTAATPFAQVAQMAVAGNNVYVLLEGPVLGLPGLVMLRSTDDGATWAGSSLAPNVVSGQSMQAFGNDVCVAWSEPSRTIAVSADAGTTWQTHPGTSPWSSGGLGSPVIALHPPTAHVCWVGRRYLGPGYVWDPIDVEVSGDGGATWHIAQRFGGPWSSGPAQFLVTDQMSGLVWSDGAALSGSPLSPTNLHYASIYGYERFGPGKPGSGGIVPRIEVSGGPWLGNTVTVSVAETAGGAVAMLGASLAGEANAPLGSGVLLLANPAVGFWGLATGVVGQPGAGTLALPLAIPNASALHRQRVTFQGFALDASAADGFASSAGLSLVIL